MKNGKKNLWKAVKKAAELEADMKNTGWPPDCSGFLYQPKRPKKNKKQCMNWESTIEKWFGKTIKTWGGGQLEYQVDLILQEWIKLQEVFRKGEQQV